MNADRLDDLVTGAEACLFAAGAPVPEKALAEALECSLEDVRAALHELTARRRGSGVEVEPVAGGVQMRTSVHQSARVQRLLGARPQRLSQAALEVLAIVAWRQPVTRGEIESMRGVDSGGVLKTLLERSLLRTAGRAEEPGRPLLYRTSAAFLELFRLPDLKALPTLAERASLARGYAGPEDEPDELEEGTAEREALPPQPQ